MKRAYVMGAVLVAAVVGGLVFLLWNPPLPSVSETAVRDALMTTIQEEAPEAFVVTGRLELTARTRVENTRTLLPGIVGLNLGTTRSTVRVPGRVSYGFQADSLRPEMVRMQEDGSVEVDLPPLAVYSVEADLSALEVETERGWLRLGVSDENVERRALAIVQPAMRRQALSHLRSSYQPRINTARALERLLAPTLRGLGMEDPKLRFVIGGNLVVEPRD
ncbi:MAG TPA: DUF4230 domain-containing protein [Longimicrobiales bacterium]|nr:DUF4230 domain-containing protein [Longimicrobiales bacterium]